jgi:endonuclease/exonuclease/phosphatase (EEP) superfamily protein YafD
MIDFHPMPGWVGLYINWAVGVLLLASFMPYLAPSRKFSELLSHFKLQYAVGSILLLLLSWIAASYWNVAASALTLIINLSAIAPFYFAGMVRQPDSRRLRVALANINHTNFDYVRFASWAEAELFDVLVVQEINEGWASALEELNQQYPFSIVSARDQGSGIALYSRTAMDSHSLELGEGDARPGIHASLKINDTTINIVAFHPRAPIRKGHFALRNQMLDSAATCLQGIANPKICIGDFNTSPWSYYYKNFLRQTQLKDARKGNGLLTTWPTFLIFRWFMIPIDHCLISKNIRVLKIETGPRIGSDHLPLIIDLQC